MASGDANFSGGGCRRAALLGGLGLCAALVALNALVAWAGPADSLGQFNEIRAAASQPDGKVITAGSTADCKRTVEGPPCEYEAVVARFDANGQLDPTFGGDGIVKLKLPGGQGNPANIAVGPEGTITIGLSDALRDGEAGFSALARLLPDGSLDQSFGSDGVATLAIHLIHGMAMLPDGALIVLGEDGPGGQFGSRLLRVEPNGGLDPNFAPSALGETLTVEAGPVVGPDGQVYVAGGFGKDPHYGAGVLRLQADGQVDKGFGVAGVAAIPTPEETNPGYRTRVEGLALQPDGAVLVSVQRPASYRAPTVGDLIRLRGDGSVDFDLGSACGGAVAVEDNGNILNTRSEFQRPPCVEQFTPAGARMAGAAGAPLGNVVAVEADGRVLISRGLGGENGYVGTSAYVAVSSVEGLDRDFGLAFLPRLTCRGRNPTEIPVSEPEGGSSTPIAAGTDGADVIIGTGEADTIEGGPGRDLICAGGGDDVVHGGAGADRINGGTGADRLFGGGGRDLVFGGRGWDRLFGGEGRDRLIGGPGKDRAFGGPGRDRVRP